MKTFKAMMVGATLVAVTGFAHATAITGSLSLGGAANIDTSTNQIEFTMSEALSTFWETGSFTVLGNGGTVTFNNEGAWIDYTQLTSNSNLGTCGSGCIYTATNNGYTTTFDLTSETVAVTSDSLKITGVGTANLSGFDPTQGFFELTTQLNGTPTTNVSFSTTTSVPEPETLALFAAGLLGLSFAIGRRRRRS